MMARLNWIELADHFFDMLLLGMKNEMKKAKWHVLFLLGYFGISKDKQKK